MVLVLQNKLLQIPYLPQTLKTTHHYLYTWSSHFIYTEDEYSCFHPKNLLQPKHVPAQTFSILNCFRLIKITADNGLAPSSTRTRIKPSASPQWLNPRLNEDSPFYHLMWCAQSFWHKYSGLEKSRANCGPVLGRCILYVTMQDGEISSLNHYQKMRGCSMYLGKVSNLYDHHKSSVNLGSKGDSTVRDKDEDLLFFPIYYSNLHFSLCLQNY